MISYDLCIGYATKITCTGKKIDTQRQKGYRTCRMPLSHCVIVPPQTDVASEEVVTAFSDIKEVLKAVHLDIHSEELKGIRYETYSKGMYLILYVSDLICV